MSNYRGPTDVRIFVMGIVISSEVAPTIGEVINAAKEHGFPSINIRRQALWLVDVHWLDMIDQRLEPTSAALEHKEEWLKDLERLTGAAQVSAQFSEVSLKPIAPIPTQISTDPANPCVVLSPGPGYTERIVIVGDEAKRLTSRILECQARSFALVGGES